MKVIEKGERFGRLVVIDEYREVKNGRSRRYLVCQCDCGNIAHIDKSHVLRGYTRSCGCLQNESRKGLGSHFKKDLGESAFNETYGAYKKSARLRGYDFELTKEEFREIVTEPCIYCGESLTQSKHKKSGNGEFRYTGIDRYDNSKGYIPSNCVPCCKRCNRIKTTMSAEELADIVDTLQKRKDIWLNPQEVKENESI